MLTNNTNQLIRLIKIKMGWHWIKKGGTPRGCFGSLRFITGYTMPFNWKTFNDIVGYSNIYVTV